MVALKKWKIDNLSSCRDCEQIYQSFIQSNSKLLQVSWELSYLTDAVKSSLGWEIDLSVAIL